MSSEKLRPRPRRHAIMPIRFFAKVPYPFGSDKNGWELVIKKSISGFNTVPTIGQHVVLGGEKHHVYDIIYNLDDMYVDVYLQPNKLT